MDSLNKLTQPEKIPPKPKREEAVFTKYDAILGELKEMEKRAEYLENKEPELPPNGDVQEVEVEGRKLFTGFDGKIGVAEFCFGKKDAGSGYKYLTQDCFNKMVEKLRLALSVLEKLSIK